MSGVRTMSESDYRELIALATMSTEAIRKLWDEYDGCNMPSGISGEMIHHVLNVRGEGSYCAV